MSDSGPELDIRWPIGLLFSAMGLVVGLYGALSGARAVFLTRLVNVNLWWGLAMLIFGLAMIWGAVAGRRQHED
jgi:hypothetical protein